MHAYIGFVLFNLFSPLVNRWVLLVAVVALMCGVACVIHRLAEVRLARRLKRALIRLADARDRWLPGAGAVPRPRLSHRQADADLVTQRVYALFAKTRTLDQAATYRLLLEELNCLVGALTRTHLPGCPSPAAPRTGPAADIGRGLRQVTTG